MDTKMTGTNNSPETFQVQKEEEEKKKKRVPVDPTDHVMFRLKLLDAFMDISKFLVCFR